MTDAADISPRVGIFWGVCEEEGAIAIVTDSVALREAEPYGEFLTHPRGHYDVWENWKSLGVRKLQTLGLPKSIAWAEYEEFPRGRVVFNTVTNRFTIYADTQLQTPELISQIVDELGLSDSEFRVESDAHYRTNRKPQS